MIKEIISFAGAYRLKNIKSLHTYDGLAWTATLYKDGKRIGDVQEDGHGGMLQIRVSRSDSDALLEYAKTKVDPAFEPSETFLSTLCDYTEAINKMKRAAKKKIIVLDADERDDHGVPTSYSTFAYAPTPQNLEAIRTKRPEYRLLADEVGLWA